MTNLVKIAKSIAIKTNRNNVNDYLSMGNKLMCQLTASALDPEREKILSSIAFLENDERYYSALLLECSALITAMPLICLPIIILVREYDIQNQNSYYGLIVVIILTIIARGVLNLRRQSISFYALGALTQLVDKNIEK